MSTDTPLSRRAVTATGLKVIALVTMFLDHLAATVLYGLLTAAGSEVPAAGTLLYGVYQNWNLLAELYDLLRTVGRLAFPIYCFLLVQGFLHTRSVPRYALRLFLFALISEIPFDLAFNGTVLEWSYNNVFFTLLTGLITLWCIRKVHQRLSPLPWTPAAKHILYALAAVAFTFSFGSLADGPLLSSDYGAAGIVTIVLMYLLRDYPPVSYGLGVLVLTLLVENDMTLFALVGILPILFYRGQQGRPAKYLFYLFYPAHLLLLAGVAALLPI